MEKVVVFYFNLKPRSRFYWMRKSAYCSMFSGLCSAHWSFGYLLVYLKQHAWLGCRCAWRGSMSPVGTNCANWWVWKRIVISMQLREHGIAPIGYGLHESHDVTAGMHCITSLRSRCGMVSAPGLMLIAHLLPVGMPLWNPWSLSESFRLRRPMISPTLMRCLGGAGPQVWAKYLFGFDRKGRGVWTWPVVCCIVSWISCKIRTRCKLHRKTGFSLKHGFNLALPKYVIRPAKNIPAWM